MSMLEHVLTAMASWPQPRYESSAVFVPTQVLYPSNGIVELRIEGKIDCFVVSDNGGAWDVLEGAGGHDLPGTRRVLMSVVKRYGFKISAAGEIVSPMVPHAALSPTMALVANVSREAAEHLMRRFRPRLDKNFRANLESFLKVRFGESLRTHDLLTGVSNKPHRVDYIVPLGDGKRLAIDSVVPDTSSINAAVVTHLDLQRAGIAGLEQRIVFDDMAEWKSADLNLLRTGATPVPFSQLPRTIERLAA